jgi:glycosyltransferase involved in cell wall biosynthesis
MIRVLLVPSSDYLGHPFPQRHNQIFERLNDKKDFEVHVARFVLFDKPRMNTSLVVHDLGGRKYGNVAFYYLLNAANHASQIRRIIRQESIDVVVLSNLAAPLAYTLLEGTTSAKIPMIFDLPDYYPASAAGYLFDVESAPGRSVIGVFDSFLSFMIRRASVVTAASPSLVEYARQAKAKEAMQVPNGIGECFLKLHNGENLRNRLGFDKEELVVGYIGSLEFWLDMKSLIKGVGLARKRGVPSRLLIVGKELHTKYSEKVKEYVRQENLEKCTERLDFVPYDLVPEYMSGLDVGTIPFNVYNPTAYYSAPNKLWEYLSQMRPVIATPIPEVLNNSDCLIPALTPADYAEGFLKIAKRKTEVQRKTATGYKKALTKTWKHSAAIYGGLIHSLLEGIETGVIEHK